MSYGQDAVGLTFNPSQDPDVHEVKTRFAEVIDFLDDMRKGLDSRNSEKIRLCSVAITEAQTAQMWAVKAITWQLK